LKNSDTLDFIIQELSIVLKANEFDLGYLKIRQLKIHITYNSAIWKFSIEGNVNSMAAKIIYDNEKRQIHTILIPFQNKSLGETFEVLTNEKIPDDAISQLNINSVNLAFNVDDKIIEKFSIELEGTLKLEKINLD
ncbi:9008_t:CDS:1, partial [Ambispora leptoticha]